MSKNNTIVLAVLVAVVLATVSIIGVSKHRAAQDRQERVDQQTRIQFCATQQLTSYEDCMD